MPPKKIKLLEKPSKSVKVDSDDVDIQDEETKLNKPSKTIISKTKIKMPDPIIKDEEVKVEEIKEEEVKVSKPNTLSKMPLKYDSNINEPESENKIKQQNPKSKKNTLIKQSESAFDMFGDDKDDYREILINYDYTKNKTLPKITKYERALLIGKRAKQIEDGANPNIKVMPGQSSIEIAEEELRQRKIPLIIKRPNGNTFEYWKPADMEVFMD